MCKQTQFFKRAETQLGRLDTEIDALEKTIKANKSKRHWYEKQLPKMRNEWRLIRARIERMSNQIMVKGRSPISQFNADAESHWLALETVIALYRRELEAA